MIQQRTFYAPVERLFAQQFNYTCTLKHIARCRRQAGRKS